MQTINNERVIYVDIDETLVMHNTSWAFTNSRIVTVTDPYSGERIDLIVNRPMVRIVKEEKARGAFIIVHSAGGYAWAETIINSLELADKVDLILSKPFAYLDDKDASEWMGRRIYIGPDVVYKK